MASSHISVERRWSAVVVFQTPPDLSSITATTTLYKFDCGFLNPTETQNRQTKSLRRFVNGFKATLL
jgi:hypothetical protein